MPMRLMSTLTMARSAMPSSATGMRRSLSLACWKRDSTEIFFMVPPWGPGEGSPSVLELLFFLDDLDDVFRGLGGQEGFTEVLDLEEGRDAGQGLQVRAGGAFGGHQQEEDVHRFPVQGIEADAVGGKAEGRRQVG